MVTEPLYFDRFGKPLERRIWSMLCNTPSYVTVRHWSDGDGSNVIVRWRGEEEHRFELIIEGFESLTYWPDGFYLSEQSAINQYESFLVENTECEFVPSANAKSGVRFMEVGNTAKRPTLDDDEELRTNLANEDFGTW